MRGRLALAAALLGAQAFASDTHYQNFLIGQRAMGMGGAFTALADDPSASWYNPGGLALMPRTSGTAGLTLYGIELRGIDEGLSGPVGAGDLRQIAFPILPTTLSVMTKFGGNKRAPRNAIGVSLFLPFSESVGFRRVLQMGGEAAVHQVAEGGRTLWVGPSYARRIGPDLGLGFSLFYDNRTFGRQSEISAFLTSPRPGLPCEGVGITACSLAASVDAMVGTLFARVGALWRVNAEWKVGAAFSTPTLHLHGSAEIFHRRFSAGSGGTRHAVGLAEVPAFSHRPFELRLGASFTRAWYTLAGDLSIHGPTTYRRVDMSEPIADPLFVREVRREAVANVNVGAEFLARPTVPVRVGFYTNFSSAPEIPERTSVPHLARLHSFGWAASIGYLGEGYGLDFGVSLSAGWGVAQALDRTDPTTFRRVGASQTLLYFFVSGIGQALARKVQRLLDRFKWL